MRRELLALSVVVAILAVPASGAVVVVANPIQPGDRTAWGCTLNFVFDDPDGDVYIGIAAHCVREGKRVATSGHGDFGTVVFDVRERSGFLDVALIEVDEDKEDLVRPWVKGHPDMPTGVAESNDTVPGDLLQMSGYGQLTQATEPTREERKAVIVWQNRLQYCSEAPVSGGDSGGPLTKVLDGEAVGIVSRLGTLSCPGTLTGPTIEAALHDLDKRGGFNLTLRTV